MRIDIHISEAEAGKFQRACEATIMNVGSGTLMAVTEAAQEIMMEAMNQVPRDTGTLARSAFVGTSRRTDLKNYRYGAVLGFGAYQGIASATNLVGIDWIWPPNNGINPKNGLRASVYATRVHEDLKMPHRNGGNAKFLENPVREWASGRYARTTLNYWRLAIEQFDRVMQTGMSVRQLERLKKLGKIDDYMSSEAYEAKTGKKVSRKDTFKNVMEYRGTRKVFQTTSTGTLTKKGFTPKSVQATTPKSNAKPKMKYNGGVHSSFNARSIDD